MPIPETMPPPGFRFHPTDQELILHYLRNRVTSTPVPVSIIAQVDIYKFDPWFLPEKAVFGDREWYFFSPRERKYPNGVRPNRAAASGYWKATGTDRPIVSSSGEHENIGVKKSLVFYRGKPPKGIKTNWIMHEYRLAGSSSSSGSSNTIHQHPPNIMNRDTSMRLDDWVLCRIYNKNSNNHNPSTPSSTDRDREEEPNTEDSQLPTLQELTHPSNLNIPKSGTFLSEILEENDNHSMLNRFLYENPPDVSSQQPQLVGSLHSSIPTAVTNQSVIFQPNSQTAPVSSSAIGNQTSGHKRQRISDGYFDDENGGVLLHHPPNKYNINSLCTSTNFGNQTMNASMTYSNYFNNLF